MIDHIAYSGKETFREKLNRYKSLNLLDAQFGQALSDYKMPYPVSIIYTTASVNSKFYCSIMDKGTLNMNKDLALFMTFGVLTFKQVVAEVSHSHMQMEYTEDLIKLKSCLSPVHTAGGTQFTFDVISLNCIDRASLMELMRVDTIRDITKMFRDLYAMLPF